MEKPYIYILKNKLTGQFYIGSQCSGKILGKNYFTSACGKNNNWLPKDFKENRENYDYWKIASFDNADECFEQEQKLIKENFKNELLLNESYFLGNNMHSNLKYRTPEEKLLKKQKEIARKKQWNERNKDIISQKRKKFYEENKEKFHDYHFKNRERILKRQKEHYEKNREYLIEHSKNYQKNHREETLKRKREYHKKNREKEKKYNDIYKKEHKDEIKLKKKEYYKKNREKEKMYSLTMYYIKKNKNVFEQYKSLPKDEKRVFRENFIKENNLFND